MNVLIFVMTLLMLLSLMTYARLETYRSSQVFQIIFKSYMEKDERGYFNSRADSIYNTIKVSTNSKKPGGQKAEGNPRLGISLLIDKKAREEKTEAWNQTKLLLKNLLNVLYEDQPFYKDALEKNLSLQDNLIDALVKEIDDLPKEKELKTAADLANLKLQDPNLDIFLYKILQGAVYHDINAIKKEKKTNLLKDGEKVESTIVDESEDDESAENESLEFKSNEGYYSLLDFITIKGEPKIRVFLARPEVLSAVFSNEQTVQNILNTRKLYHRRAVNGEDPKELTEAFKLEFEKAKDPGISSKALDFTVTKTNPKKYEGNK